MIAAAQASRSVRAAIGATSLAYLSLEGLQAATRRAADGRLPRLPDRQLPDPRFRAAREAPLRARPHRLTACASPDADALATSTRVDDAERRPGATPPPVSRLRSRTPSSSACAPPPSRPARAASARSPGCTRSTSGRLLAASTDGVGTKLMLARARGRLRDCGADLAAHCINDVITTGATPLLLLDYVAAAQIDLEQVAEIVEGAAEVCRAAGVALVGGETAELPGIYRDGELDAAGTCVGVVERGELIDGRDGRERRRGDRFRLGRRTRERLHARAARCSSGRTTTAPDLLAPTRLYLGRGAGARAAAPRRSRTSPAAASPATSPASCPPGRTAEIDWDAWERPPVFALARAPRRRGRAATGVQPRDRLLRRRRAAGSPASR